MITYLAASGNQEIILTDTVLKHFSENQQSKPFDLEAGGQLFCRFEDNRILIELATGPRCLDKRSRYSFIPSKWADRAEIRKYHLQGLNYVGDWHTHPERVPTQSEIDRKSMHEMFAQSRHNLAGFLMIIVGTDPAPQGLFVAIFGSATSAKLVSVTS